MSLFEMLLGRRPTAPDYSEIRTDGAAVIISSRLLGCTEFELFRIAHEQWFGCPISEAAVEDVFKPYVFTGDVPFWVRFFANRVLELNERDELNPDEFCPPLENGIDTRRNVLIA